MIDYDMLNATERGEERLAALRKSIETNDDPLDGIKLRYMLMNESTFHGDKTDLINGFDEFRDYLDDHIDEVDEKEREEAVGNFMIVYKWLIEDIKEFPEVSFEKCEQYFTDFKQRCKKEGFSLRTFYEKKADFYYTIDKEKAAEYTRLFDEEEEDELGDCEACSQAFRIRMALFSGDEQRAVEMFSEMISKNLSCGEQPENTAAIFAQWFLKLGYVREADFYADRALAIINDSDASAEELARCMVVKAFTDGNKAYDIMKTLIPFFQKSKNTLEKLIFAVGSREIMRILSEDEDNSVSLDLSKDHELYNEDGVYSSKALYEFFSKKAEEFAKALDERESGSYYTDYINAVYAEKPEKPIDFPVHCTAERQPAGIIIPFKSAESFPDPDTLLSTIDSVDGIDVLRVHIDEDDGVVAAIVYDTANECETEMRFMFRGGEDFGEYDTVHDDVTSNDLSGYETMIVAMSMLQPGKEHSQFALLLRAANALNTDDAPAFASISTQTLLSAKWVGLLCEKNLVPEEKYLYRIVVMQSDEDEELYNIATLGLRCFGCRELFEYNIEEEDFDFCAKVLRQAANQIVLRGSLADEGIPFNAGLVYDEDTDVRMSWKAAEDFTNDDEKNFAAVPFLHFDEEGEPTLPQDMAAMVTVLVEARDSAYHESLENRAAKFTYDIAKEEFLKNGGEMIVGFTEKVPAGYDGAGKNATLFVKVGEDGKTGTVDSGYEWIDEFNRGKEIDINEDTILFWRIEDEDRYYFADDAYLFI